MLTEAKLQTVQSVLERLDLAISSLDDLAERERKQTKFPSDPAGKRVSDVKAVANRLQGLRDDIEALYS